MSCGYELNTEEFKKYANESAEIFVEHYAWFKMPARIHKILIHGADVMETLLLPIGQFSEEALEARHKKCCYFREHNSRKNSRQIYVEDLHALLVSSDPLISSIRNLPKRRINKLPQPVINILKVAAHPPELSRVHQKTHPRAKMKILQRVILKNK